MVLKVCFVFGLVMKVPPVCRKHRTYQRVYDEQRVSDL